MFFLNIASSIKSELLYCDNTNAQPNTSHSQKADQENSPLPGCCRDCFAPCSSSLSICALRRRGAVAVQADVRKPFRHELGFHTYLCIYFSSSLGRGTQSIFSYLRVAKSFGMFLFVYFVSRLHTGENGLQETRSGVSKFSFGSFVVSTESVGPPSAAAADTPMRGFPKSHTTP